MKALQHNISEIGEIHQIDKWSSAILWTDRKLT